MSQNHMYGRLIIYRIILIRFEETYQENYKTMFCIAKKMVNDSDVVSDIVQEVFVYYFEKLKNGHEIHYPKSWLIRAVINKSFDYLSKQKRFQNIDSINTPTSLDDSFEKKEDKAVISLALSNLKQKERILLVLYSEGFSYKEISEITDINFSSIGKMLSRALTKLKEELKKLKYELY